MGVNLSGVNLDGVDPNVALDAIPAGWYNAQIVGSEMKPTKDQMGQYLELTMQVIDGEHAGRKLFDRLNLVNNNPTAVEIAFKTMKAIYNALGVARVNDSAELHGKPLKVKVKLRPKTAEYDATNEVQGYDHIQSQHTPAGVTAGGVAGAPNGAPPWANGAAGAPAGGAPAFAGNAPAANGFPGAASPAPAAAGSAPGGWQPPGAQSQPWQQPGQQAPAGGPPAFNPAPPAQVDPMANARADGWQAHPQHPGYSWRGNDVVADAELAAHYPVAPAPAAAPSGPPAFNPPAAAAAPAQTPPWQAGAAAAGGAPASGGPSGPAPASVPPQGGAPVPPWARG
jgi:hypothetical protein